MKNITKRIFSCALILMLVLQLSLQVFASEPASINLDKTEFTVTIGQTGVINAVILPVLDQEEVNWGSSKEAVATVKKSTLKGTVTGRSYGSALIKCVGSITGQRSAECQVVVVPDVVRPASPTLSLNASTGTLSGNARVVSDGFNANFKSGSRVAGLDNNGGTLTMTFNASEGSYLLDIYYADISETRSMNIDVNGVRAYTTTVYGVRRASGLSVSTTNLLNYRQLIPVSVIVELQDGVNTIVFSASNGANSPLYDAFDLFAVPAPPPIGVIPDDPGVGPDNDFPIISGEGDWQTIQGILSNIYGEVTEPMTATDSNNAVVQNKFTAGAFVGNGTLGVVAGGKTTSEQRFYLGHNDMWGSVIDSTAKDGVLSLGGMTIRTAGPGSDAAGEYYMKQNLLSAQIETKLQVKDVASQDALIEMNSYTGDGVDNTFFITEIKNNGENAVALSADVWVPDFIDRTTSAIGTGNVLTRDAINAYPYASGIADSGQTLWARRQVNRLTGSNDAATALTTDYTARGAIVAKLLGADFGSTSSNRGMATGSFTVPAGETVSVVIYVRVSNAGTSSGSSVLGYMKEALKSADANRDAAIGELNAKIVEPGLVERIKSEHRQWWKDFWLASYIQIPYESLMKYYYGAQYVLGCNQRADQSHPGSMWGVLNTQDSNAWGGRYFLNYNQEAQYYGAGSSNHPDTILPYSRLITWETRRQLNFTAAAGYNGMIGTRTLSPFALYKAQTTSVTNKAARKNPTTLSASSHDQKSNGTFAAMPLIWYYEYTMDQNYLENTLYPYLYELAEFYLDFAEVYTAETEWRFAPGSSKPYFDFSDKWEIRDGYIYMIDNSSVHEADPKDLSPGLDIASAERLVRFMLEYSPKLNRNLGKMSIWQDFLDHLCDYPQRTFSYEDYSFTHSSVMPDYGDLTVICAAYGISPDTPSTNNHIFVIEPYDQPVELEPVFPFESETILNDPIMVQRAINTMKYMNSWCISTGAYKGNTYGSLTNGFCKTYPIAARIGWPAEDLIDKYRNTESMKNFRDSNLTCQQAGGGLETIGCTEFINSLLMQSEVGKVRVFPNWVEGKDASFTRLLAKGAFEISSEYKDSEVTYVEITSKAGGELKLLNPWASEPIVMSNRGNAISYTVDVAGYITLNTVKGESYIFVPSDGGNYFNAFIGDDEIVCVFANGSISDISGTFIIAAYKDGKLKYTDSKSFSTDAGHGASYPFAFAFEDYPADEYQYKAFCWDENFVPLAKSIVL